jgi:hypothetical protein
MLSISGTAVRTVPSNAFSNLHGFFLLLPAQQQFVHSGLITQLLWRSVERVAAENDVFCGAQRKDFRCPSYELSSLADCPSFPTVQLTLFYDNNELLIQTKGQNVQSIVWQGITGHICLRHYTFAFIKLVNYLLSMEVFHSKVC